MMSEKLKFLLVVDCVWFYFIFVFYFFEYG